MRALTCVTSIFCILYLVFEPRSQDALRDIEKARKADLRMAVARRKRKLLGASGFVGAASPSATLLKQSSKMRNMSRNSSKADSNIERANVGSTRRQSDALPTSPLEGHFKWLDVAIKRMRWFLGTKLYAFGMLTLIITNTVILGLDKYPVWDDATANLLELLNFIFTMIFTVEMFTKLSVMGVRQYARDKSNTFDALVVSVSVFEVCLAPPVLLVGYATAASGAKAASGLRALRLFRVFRIAKSWTSFNNLLKTMWRTMADLANFTVLLILITYIFALFGMQFFANSFHFDPSSNLQNVNVTDPRYALTVVPRQNFDSLNLALLCVFQVRGMVTRVM